MCVEKNKIIYLNFKWRCASGGCGGGGWRLPLGSVLPLEEAAPYAGGNDDGLGAAIGLSMAGRRVLVDGGVVGGLGDEHQPPGHQQHRQTPRVHLLRTCCSHERRMRTKMVGEKLREVAGESDTALHADRSKAPCRPTTMPLSQRLTTRGSAFPIIIVPGMRA